MDYANDDNVILFPKWKSKLEAESLQALKEKRYEAALEKLNKLLSFQIQTHEIMIAKLICLIELDQYEKAKTLCQSLIENPDENYYHYLHIYLTVLFQTNEYTSLMDYLENEIALEEIPVELREQFNQLYDLSFQMKQDIDIEKGLSYEKDLQKAFEQDNYQAQWRLIDMMRQIKFKPSEQWIQCLSKEQIHPVIKTAILHWLQDSQVNEAVAIHKFGRKHDVIPIDIPGIESHTIMKQTLLIFNELEQNNPTLHHLIKSLLYQYIYVRYPFFPSTENILPIAKALQHIGENYMNLHHNEKNGIEDNVIHYIEEISLCQTLYLSIIED